MPTQETVSIAEQNDRFRQTFVGGLVTITPQVQALEAETKNKLLAAVRQFDEFTEDNDPYGEHDFGSVKLAGETWFWKIDLYDTNYEYRTPDPLDLGVTRRVLTVMQAHEY